MTSGDTSEGPERTPDDQSADTNDRANSAADARTIVRCALKAALATLDSAGDQTKPRPHASLVTVATDVTGAPLMLLSTLAVHTRNLEADPRASLLFDGTGHDGDPLAGGRVTLNGTVEKTNDPDAARRFLSRHPASEMYASFADFAFFRMSVTNTHYIGGFGRIIGFEPTELMVKTDGAEKLLEAEPGIVSHMNQDHADTLALYATRLLGAGPQDGPWRMTAIDPAGIDIVGRASTLRLEFKNRVTTPEEARAIFKKLAETARTKPA